MPRMAICVRLEIEQRLWIPAFAGMAGVSAYGAAIFCGRQARAGWRMEFMTFAPISSPLV